MTPLEKAERLLIEAQLLRDEARAALVAIIDAANDPLFLAAPARNRRRLVELARSGLRASEPTGDEFDAYHAAAVRRTKEGK
jgi:hypothetical protein